MAQKLLLIGIATLCLTAVTKAQGNCDMCNDFGYQPVCGDDLQTYSNWCMAKCLGGVRNFQLLSQIQENAYQWNCSKKENREILLDIFCTEIG